MLPPFKYKTFNNIHVPIKITTSNFSHAGINTEIKRLIRQTGVTVLMHSGKYEEHIENT